MAWMSLPAGTAASTVLRKRMNSWCRCCCMQRPMTPAVHHIEGCEQRGGAVPDVVVRHGATAAFLQRQARLGAVERLDLALFIDREHDGMRRRLDVEPDDLLQRAGELRIVGQLEQTRLMRLQPVPAPDALHRADTDALNLG